MEKISKEKKLKSFAAKAAGTAVLAAGMLVGGDVANAESNAEHNNRIANAVASATGKVVGICRDLSSGSNVDFDECVEYGKVNNIDFIALKYYDGTTVAPEALCRAIGSSQLRLDRCILRTQKGMDRNKNAEMEKSK